MLSKRFRECQSKWFVLESAPREVSRFSHSPPNHMGLVSSQSFPHLWKKLWKIGGKARLRPIFFEMSRIWRGESVTK